MDKKVLGIIIVVVIVAVAIFGYFQWGNKGGQKAEEGNKFNGVIDNPVENMPETNPFETKVNPMEGYTNPFEE